jgi:hypothetical protein
LAADNSFESPTTSGGAPVVSAARIASSRESAGSTVETSLQFPEKVLAAKGDRAVADDPEPGVKLPFDPLLRRTAVPDRRKPVLLVGVTARKRQLRHVPMQLRQSKPEHPNRAPSDQVQDLVQMLRDRIQRATEPVVVQFDRRNPKHLLNREPLAPIHKRRQRPRTREPITDHRLEHPPVREIRDRTDRAEPIDYLDKPQPVRQRLHNRQRPSRANHEPTLALHTHPLRHTARGPFHGMCEKPV